MNDYLEFGILKQFLETIRLLIRGVWCGVVMVYGVIEQ